MTAAVCTRNRAADVGRCLEALSGQARAHGIGLVVVDSGSDPGPAAALRAHAAWHGARHLRVDRPGLAEARNRAMAACDSDWVAFLDDDAVPYPDWARNLLARLDDLPGDVAVLGGMIVPRWSGAPPERMTRRWELLLSCVTAASSGYVGPDGRRVCGANLIVNRREALAAGGFPTRLGRDGRTLLSGEEAFLNRRLGQAGRRVMYDAAIRVDHVIPAERTRLSWAARRAYWEGVSRVRLDADLGGPAAAGRRAAKLVATLPLLWLMSLSGRDADWTIRYNMARGALAEKRGLTARGI